MDNKSFIATFNSTHHALKFEKSAKESHIEIVIMPVPRSIAASCGLAVKFYEESIADIINLIRDKELNYAELYKIEDSNGKKEYIKIGMGLL